jgi:hypothetical protein
VLLDWFHISSSVVCIFECGSTGTPYRGGRWPGSSRVRVPRWFG